MRIASNVTQIVESSISLPENGNDRERTSIQYGGFLCPYGYGHVEPWLAYVRSPEDFEGGKFHRSY